MSSFEFNADNDFDEVESVVLSDEEGRNLECYIENALEAEDGTYLLLMPMDTSVVIMAWEEDSEDETPNFIEDFDEMKLIFPDARAVLAELDLSLQFTAFTLTVQGELPPIEDDGILTLELDDEGEDTDPEELQFLASFYHQKKRYSIYTPLAPLLFLAKANLFGELEIISPENEDIQPILEELLFEEESE